VFSSPLLLLVLLVRVIVFFDRLDRQEDQKQGHFSEALKTKRPQLECYLNLKDLLGRELGPGEFWK
jgi:hypothetical protein